MSLPEKKKDALKKQVETDVRKVFNDHYDNLRKHEVDHKDAQEIVVEGFQKGYVGGTHDADAKK